MPGLKNFPEKRRGTDAVKLAAGFDAAWGRKTAYLMTSDAFVTRM
jgi:hypothetical protein